MEFKRLEFSFSITKHALNNFICAQQIEWEKLFDSALFYHGVFYFCFYSEIELYIGTLDVYTIALSECFPSFFPPCQLIIFGQCFPIGYCSLENNNLFFLSKKIFILPREKVCNHQIKCIKFQHPIDLFFPSGFLWI